MVRKLQEKIEVAGLNMNMTNLLVENDGICDLVFEYGKIKVVQSWK